MSNQKQIYISKDTFHRFNAAVSVLQKSGYEESFSAIVVKAVIEAAKAQQIYEDACQGCPIYMARLEAE